MQGMSERQYAAHAGLSRGAIQKAKATDRLVLFSDGSIDAAGSDAKRAAATDPSKQRNTNSRRTLKPVPDAALSAVGDTLRENGLTTTTTAGGTTFLQAKTANEVLKAQEPRATRQDPAWRHGHDRRAHGGRSSGLEGSTGDTVRCLRQTSGADHQPGPCPWRRARCPASWRDQL